MRGQHDAGLLGHRHELAQENAEPLPKLVRADRHRCGTRPGGAVAHVPDDAVGQRQIGIDRGEVEPDRHGLAARERPARPAPDAGDREIVADAGNAGAAGVAHQTLQPLDLRRPIGAAEQHVGPEARREILDRGELQARCRAPCSPGRRNRHRSTSASVEQSPQPSVSRAGRKAGVTAAEIVGEMRHDVRRASLAGEAEILGRQRLAVKSKSDLHDFLRPSPDSEAGGQAAVDLVVRAGAEAGFRRAQEGDQFRHLLRFADAAERVRLAEALVGGLDIGIAAVRRRAPPSPGSGCGSSRG